MPNRESTRHPDHRHLRRAADAVAGADTSRDVWVAVEVKADGPFDAEVLANQEAIDKFRANPTFDNYAIIPCRGERPVLSKKGAEAFIVIEHEPWSPLCPWCSDIARKDITGMELRVTFEATNEDGTKAKPETRTIPLGKREGKGCEQRKGMFPDAVFFSFEALDKYVFPSLTASYGLKDASSIRNAIKKSLNDQVTNKGFAWEPSIEEDA